MPAGCLSLISADNTFANPSTSLPPKKEAPNNRLLIFSKTILPKTFPAPGITEAKSACISVTETANMLFLSAS